MELVICQKSSMPMSSYSTHDHSTTEIIIQAEGETITTVGTEEFILKEGSVLIVPPNCEHSGKSKGLFRDYFFRVKDLPYKNAFVVNDQGGMIMATFNLVHQVYTQKEIGYELITDTLTDAIKLLIDKNAAKTYKYPFVEEFKNLIYHNVSNPDFLISAEVKKLGFSDDYFRRCFKEDLGVTAHDYLTSLRLEQAKKLLRHELSFSVEEIAFECGFSDNFYFSRLFKKTYGVSPLNYRKTN
jgi:AraC-like DNA-binding protein